MPELINNSKLTFPSVALGKDIREFLRSKGIEISAQQYKELVLTSDLQADQHIDPAWRVFLDSPPNLDEADRALRRLNTRLLRRRLR